MSRPPAHARRLAESYAADFLADLDVAPEHADDGAVLVAATSRVPAVAADLLEMLWLAAPAGDPLPERFRTDIQRHGEPLWRALLLLPRTTTHAGADVHPRRYAGACRLNPALREWRPALPLVASATPTFPPSDARWDAVVVAAALEQQPGPLTMDGVLRKDVERRLFAGLGDDDLRWSLALQVGRLMSLVRPSEGRLHGFPESVPRPLGDPAALFADSLRSTVAAVVARALTDDWLDVDAWLDRLRDHCRTIAVSPPYPDERTFDREGWAAVEQVAFEQVFDTLDRAGIVDAARGNGRVVAARRAHPRPAFARGFLLTPDHEMLVHTGELTSPEYGRLARLAPYVDGARMHRHRLTRDGVAADLGAGNRDTEEFLRTHSRTGLPPGTSDILREWQRSATRVTVLTGVDIEEDEHGAFRIAVAPGPAVRVLDYARPLPARFLYHRGRITIPDATDALTVRATVARVARFDGRDGDQQVWIPERRAHPAPDRLLARLREFYGGELPGEIELQILEAGEVVCVPATLVRLPEAVVDALRRDWIAGPLLRRAVSRTEALVPVEDVAALRERLAALGIAWKE